MVVAAVENTSFHYLGRSHGGFIPMLGPSSQAMWSCYANLNHYYYSILSKLISYTV